MSTQIAVPATFWESGITNDSDWETAPAVVEWPVAAYVFPSVILVVAGPGVKRNISKTSCAQPQLPGPISKLYHWTMSFYVTGWPPFCVMFPASPPTKT